MNATAHKAITRPRIWGSVPICSVELAIDKNETLAKPTSAIATSSIANIGASPAKVMNTAKINDARIIARTPVFPRAAVQSPPMTAPVPMAANKAP